MRHFGQPQKCLAIQRIPMRFIFVCLTNQKSSSLLLTFSPLLHLQNEMELLCLTLFLLFLVNHKWNDILFSFHCEGYKIVVTKQLSLTSLMKREQQHHYRIVVHRICQNLSRDINCVCTIFLFHFLLSVCLSLQILFHFIIELNVSLWTNTNILQIYKIKQKKTHRHGRMKWHA